MIKNGFEGLLELIPTAALVVDPSGQVISINHSANQVFGYENGAILGCPIENLIAEPSRSKFYQQISQLTSSSKTQSTDFSFELVCLKRNHVEFPCEIKLTPMMGIGQEQFIVVTIWDITAGNNEEAQLLHANRQLHELSSYLLAIREEEGARISRIIHDELGQALTGLKMDLDWLRRQLDPHQQALASLTMEMSALIDGAIQIVRRIATEMRPDILVEIGLAATIESYLDDFRNRTGIRCHLRCPQADFTLDDLGTTTIFRIFQEAMTNVARHSRATEVFITLEENRQALTMRIQDNGRGIRNREIHNLKSIGLIGMRERALMRSGTIEIHGTPGKGTVVVACLPLAAK